MTDWETPLAERMRPRSLDEYRGHSSILAPGAPLRRFLEEGDVPSCILYGPPGVGKTALVRLMGRVTGRELLEINAVSAKVSELRDLVDRAADLRRLSGRSAIAFVDELYHFNRSQQDALLPSVERGEVILVGTTTENPRFEINKTLLSRLLVFEIGPLEKEDLVEILKSALTDRERGLGELELSASDDVIEAIAASAGGDGRQALTRLEFLSRAIAVSGRRTIEEDDLTKSLPAAFVRHDRRQDDHYAVISAMIKSIRGSDPDAAVYWLARLIEGGEDVRFIARRLMILAAEDVGLADPQALVVATAGADAADRVGWPEARIILSEVALYLAAAPKSNSAYLAVGKAQDAIRRGDLLAVPSHLINGQPGYQYPHDFPNHWTAQAYLPKPRRFYEPGSMGVESRIAARLAMFWRRFQEKDEKSGEPD
ncbi:MULTISPECIES: replication-associated recombination protein A [Jonquetella]|uniref:AAA ATPase n=1 Tax=Jonquetella anthropi DSM 22815 TaxID=885272 RepID=H0ULN9_9BACT|nr:MULTISPECIES: replication-associated recombination protein A [Jonquetella]EEX49245.1 ATPase, AAA family [Jonquetella anthropi E3_33 E1]EHM12504.1 AAA ATPase [Jonquetella anthropi DSM 22815]ERL24812.1 MgsA AAA+ ATPase family protein [Jonquetella sp. BV3C21]